MRKYTSIIAMISTLGLGAPAIAGQGHGQSQQGSAECEYQGQKKHAGMEGQHVRMLRFKGEVLSLRRVNISGDPEPHVLAKVSSEAGHVFLVDLGAAENLRTQDLRAGQKVSIVGRPGRLNQKPILVADKLRVGQDQMVAISRPTQTGMQSNVRVGQALDSAPRGPEGQVMLSGHILGTQDVRLRGVAEPHTIAKIRTLDGQTALIDLGPKSEVLRLQKDDFVSASGSIGRINNQQVLIADIVADVELTGQGERMLLESQ